ncbi:alternate-type signal peptide domain-containing protein [Oerskovia paurometabola]|uniref:alternate-type signal peptide domain-containing protein n=1 Tax=Oerskovia paurometabola TaxID=162170 RepID=UPI0034455978
MGEAVVVRRRAATEPNEPEEKICMSTKKTRRGGMALRGAVVAGTATAMLMGGFGAFALWSDSQAGGASGSIQTGQLALDPVDGQAQWYLEDPQGGSAQPIDLATYLASPSDVVFYTTSVSGVVQGTDITAELTVYHSSRGDTVTVSPPALSHALRARMDDVRRRLLARKTQETFGASYEPVPAPRGELVERLVAGRDVDNAAHLRWAAELGALVHERAAVQDASRRADWRADPTVAKAVNFIDSLMARPEAGQLDEIFTQTPIRPSDPGGAVATFRSRQAQWMLWQNQDLDAVTEYLRRHAQDLGPAGSFLEAQALTRTLPRGASSCVRNSH